MAVTLDLSQFGGSSGNASASSPSDTSQKLDLSAFGGSGGKVDSSAPSSATQLDLSQFGGSGQSQPSDSPWKGMINNPIVNVPLNLAGEALGALGHGVDKIEQFTGLNHIAGAARNLINTASQLNNPNIDNMTPAEREQSRPRGAELWNAIVQGFNNPDQANQNLQQGLQTSAAAGNWSPLQQGLSNFVVNAGTDPLSYVPVGGVAKVAGSAIKGALDGMGATPYLAKAADAVANAPYIQPALQGTQDVLGKMFKPNYGASPALVDAINGTRGTQAVNNDAMIRALADMSQGHNLSPDELNQIGHVVEGTMQGTPEQQAFAQQWSNAAFHGPGGENTPIPQVPSELPKTAEPVAPTVPPEPTNLDDLVKSKGFSDVTPETIAQTYNGKTWYHGSGNADLQANHLDPNAGNHESLFGQGVYLTDNPKIAQGYADSRGRRTGTPTVNDMNVNVNKVLDLEKPITSDVKAVMDKMAKPLDYSYDYHFDEPNHFTDFLNQEMSKPGATPEKVITSLKSEIKDFSHEAEIPTSQFTEDFQDLAQHFKEAGFDALTHTGGGRTGAEPHRVMIMLDPQNWHGATAGQGSQVTRMGKYVKPEPMPVKEAEAPPSSSGQGVNTPSYPLPQTGAIGTNAMLHTASAVNGEPILQNQIPNHFSHVYDNVPKELQGVFPKKDYSNGSGLSPDGTFNKPRTYDTLQEAQANGLKPVLNPLKVLGHQWEQSSNALTNNSLLQQVKNEPNLLLPKDKLDELYKLVKTGRMDSPEVTSAMQRLGLTAKDLKPGGIVQSQVPQLSGYYIRKADETALQEHLNPTQPTGANKVAQGAENLYNKGYLLNPLPHLHNILVNGSLLGGAKLGDIKDTMVGIKAGTEPMYQRALKAGAISNPVVGKFSDAVDRAVAPKGGNLASRTLDAAKVAATNILTQNQSLKSLASNLMAPLQPARDLSHNLLWNTDKAIRTTMFKNAVNSGMTDAQAAAHTNKFMVDYNNTTPFERQYIKPFVPFYAWKKGNLPLQVSQTLAQTPKYALWNNAKNAASQAISGQPTDQKGRIGSGQMLADGSQTMLDPYSPMDDVNKAAQKGLLPYLYGSLSPVIREAIAQGTSLTGYNGLDVQNKFPIYNPQAPLGYNLRAGLAHGINALNPFNSSAVLGVAGNQSNFINKQLGVPVTNPNAPGETPLETATKLLGGFTARSNPAKDALNQHYQQNQNKLDLRRFMKVEAKVNANK